MPEPESPEQNLLKKNDTSSHQVSAVIVTWNSAEFLERCITELHRSNHVEPEIVIVDNASTDNTVEIAKKLLEENRIHQLLPQTGNLGCAGGNNVGWKAANHDLILMLNADCVVDRDCVRILCESLEENPETGCVGALLLYPNSRRIQHAGATINSNGIADHPGRGQSVLESEGQEYLQEREVDFVTGACLAYRKKDMQEMGGFDEDYYPAYYEEADFCARLRKAGKTTVFLPTAKGWHYEMAGTGNESPQFIQMATNARIIFMFKNLGISEFLMKFLWQEWKWFLKSDSRGTRRYLIKSWLHGLLFAVKTIVRFRTRSLPK